MGQACQHNRTLGCLAFEDSWARQRVKTRSGMTCRHSFTYKQIDDNAILSMHHDQPT